MTIPAIKVEALSKQYTIGTARPQHGTFYDLLASSIKAPFGRMRKLAGKTGTDEKFWALHDVNFEVQPGEVLGIIGRNGAGKSTLLKILSRITAPTAGRATVHGRMASLLEVGTGFHPELSGRENIYLNGAILGMKRKEIARKFDEIVDFAEVGQFIDTPVKHYSSGMYVRLAFSVAAHLDVDLLVIDEVLAVGDIEFQRKCMARMGTVSSSGRTVLFVSHNLGAVEQLCHSAIVLDKGQIIFRGGAAESVRHFHDMCESRAEGPISSAFSGNLKDRVSITNLSVSQQGLGESRVISPREPIKVTLQGESRSDFRDLDIAIAIFHEGTRLFSCHDAPINTPLTEGGFSSEFEIPSRLLRPGRYSLAAGARRVGRDDWIWGTDLAYFDVVPEWDGHFQERDIGIISVPSSATRTQLPRRTPR